MRYGLTDKWHHPLVALCVFVKRGRYEGLGEALGSKAVATFQAWKEAGKGKQRNR